MSEEKTRLKEFHKKLHDKLTFASALEKVSLEQKVLLLQRLHDYAVKNEEFTALDPDEVAASIQMVYTGWKTTARYGNTFNDFLRMVDDDIQRIMKYNRYTESSKSVNLELFVEKYNNTNDGDEREKIKKEIIKRFGFA